MTTRRILDEEEDLNKNVTEGEDTGKLKLDSRKPEGFLLTVKVKLTSSGMEIESS